MDGDDTGEKLVFREVKGTSVTTLTLHSQVVDINVDQEALQKLQAGNLTDTSHIISIRFDTQHHGGHLSKCEIEFPDSQDDAAKEVFRQLTESGYNELQTMIGKMYQNYNTMVSYIHLNPLTIGFSHRRISDFEQMRETMELNSMDWVAACFNNYPKARVVMTMDGCEPLCVQAGEVNKKDSESASDQSLIEEKFRSQRDEPKDFAKVDDNTERQFQEIERQIQNQKERMNARLQHHQTEYERMNASLQNLLKQLEERQNRKILKANEPTSGSTIQTSSRTFGKSLTLSKLTASISKSTSASAPAAAPATAPASASTSKSVYASLLTSKSASASASASESSSELALASASESTTSPPSANKSASASANEATASFVAIQRPSLGGPTWNNERVEENASYLIPAEASGNAKCLEEKPTKVLIGKDVIFKEGTKENNKDNAISNRGQTGKSNRYKRETSQTYVIPTSSSLRGAGQGESLEYGLSAVAEARIDDDVMPPKGKGLDTIICLDTSDSMGNDGLREVKQIALDFVDGIEEMAQNKDLEENIAVVKFGGRPKIVHHLSIDYNSIREKIENLELGGQTPMMEGHLVAMSALECGRGKVALLRQCHVLSPRMITITDGKPTPGYGGSSDTENAESIDKMMFVQMIQHIRSENEEPIFPRPLTWIPAGQADREFLKSLAEQLDGIFLEGNQVKTLCKYQQLQYTIAKIYSCLHLGTDAHSVVGIDKIGTALEFYAADLNMEDKNYITKAVKDKMEGREWSGNPTVQDRSFSDVRELPHLPPLGSRVVRGPDWDHSNQDGEGPGTVFQHLEDAGPGRGVLSVHWDIGFSCQCHYGRNGRYDVKVVKDQPRNTANDHIEIGCEVTRGPDWRAEHVEQDGGAGRFGVVVRKDSLSKVKVRWRETCYIGEYMYTPAGRREVMLRDPMDIIKEVTREATEDAKCQSQTAGFGPNTKTWTWKWMNDSGNWKEYSNDTVQKLEKAYSQSSSCLIRKGSQRVLFKEMMEKGIDGGSTRKVERSCVDD